MARLRTSVSLACAVGLVLSACRGDDDATPDTTIADTTTSTLPERVDDGVLTLGILLPTSNAAIGEPMIAAAEDAISRINDAGGVFDQEVEYSIADEGSNAAQAADGIQTLVDRGVDAIIGPSSSTIALSVLGQASADGVVVCSPTATSLALDAFPEKEQFFFRTIPSDSLQAHAIAETVEETGLRTASVIFVDDAYGRPFAQAVEAALDQRGIATAGAIPFTGREDDLSVVAEEAIATGAPALVVLAAAEDGTNMLNALGLVDHSTISNIVVNDAMRTPSQPQIIGELDVELREKIAGVAPQADSGDPDEPWDPPGFFAVNAYNCANLIALAALQAGSDSPRQIAGQMAAVSDTGAVCMDFAACAEFHRDNRSFDYDGPIGELELLTRQGDPSVGRFQQFSFDETGHDIVTGTLVVRY